MRRAISYARYSSAGQADGFSLERHLQAAKSYCERNGLALDERPFVDMKVSGYHGSNSTAGQLREFIELVKAGRVPKGSVLVVENTDRISRLPPDQATNLIMDIVNAGVEVVTLSPEQRYTKANIHSVGVWVPLQVSICLAREESVKKADRLKDAWGRKRKALAGGGKLSRTAPFWLRLSADRKTWVVLKKKADLMRRVFGWCADGLGVTKITKRLHEECPGGITGRGWQPNNVRKLLRSRAVIGELRPHVRQYRAKDGGGVWIGREATGQTVAGYYPAIVGEDVFYRAQAAMDARRVGGGRATGTPNLFNGFLYDARDGRRMVLGGNKLGRYLVSSGAVRRIKGSVHRSIPYDDFEKAILSRLAELKTADVVGKAAPAEDEVEKWSGKLAAVNHNIEKTRKKAAEADDSSAFFDLIDDLTAQRKVIIANLEAAKARAASPAGDALGECVSLVELLANAEGDEREELRAKVRGSLRRLVDTIYVLIVPRGYVKLAAVQVWFKGGRHRDYLIRRRRPNGDRAEESEVQSVVFAGKSGGFDLRNPEEAAEVERRLGAVDPGLDLAANVDAMLRGLRDDIATAERDLARLRKELSNRTGDRTARPRRTRK
jgi:hypothetical protein